MNLIVFMRPYSRDLVISYVRLWSFARYDWSCLARTDLHFSIGLEVTAEPLVAFSLLNIKKNLVAEFFLHVIYSIRVLLVCLLYCLFEQHISNADVFVLLEIAKHWSGGYR